MNTLLNHLIKLEKALVAADTRHDIDVLKKLIDIEFIEVGASGRRFGFEDVIERLPDESPMQCQQRDFECRMLSEDLAQLCYHATIFSDDGDKLSRRTSLWRFNRLQMQWQMIYHQGTSSSN